MKRGRLKLVIIFAAFLGPLLAAFIGYYGLGGALAPRGATNHAPLISPVVNLRPFSNPNPAAGAPVTLASLRQHWSVIHPLQEQCAEACQQFLYHTRQVRLALGRDAARVQRILLSPSSDLLARLAAAHPDALRLLETGAAGGLESQLAPILRRPAIGADAALLVDPLGNLMMVIPANLDPGLLLKDLKHLLKVSRIG